MAADWFGPAGTKKAIRIESEYQGKQAVISIPNGELLAGELPAKKLRLVQSWFALARVDYGTVTWPGEIHIALETLFAESVAMPKEMAR